MRFYDIKGRPLSEKASDTNAKPDDALDFLSDRGGAGVKPDDAPDCLSNENNTLEEIVSSLAPKNHLAEKKARMSLLPLDILRKYVVPAYEEGILKYERESWRRGFQVSVMVDATLRHIEAFYYAGEDYDLDSESHGIKKHHLAGAIFSLLSILHSLDIRPELDDRPKTL